MRSVRAVLAASVLVLVAGCSVYKANPRMTYYHGQNVAEGYITVLKASPTEISFQIRVEFAPKMMYHIILDGNDPVAQAWISTLRAGGQSYVATLKASKGKTFETGKTYRLCIGAQSPEAVQMESNNYQCQIDHVFVFQEK